jgi:hypothetical protein
LLYVSRHPAGDVGEHLQVDASVSAWCGGTA